MYKADKNKIKNNNVSNTHARSPIYSIDEIDSSNSNRSVVYCISLLRDLIFFVKCYLNILFQ